MDELDELENHMMMSLQMGDDEDFLRALQELLYATPGVTIDKSDVRSDQAVFMFRHEVLHERLSDTASVVLDMRKGVSPDTPITWVAHCMPYNYIMFPLKNWRVCISEIRKFLACTSLSEYKMIGK